MCRYLYFLLLSQAAFAASIGGVVKDASGVLYVSDRQINAIAPYSLFTKSSATVVVQYAGIRSNEVPVIVSPAAPGLFREPPTGTGQGAILNQDMSVNSAQNPAAKGSIVNLFGGGAGQTNPAGIDGLITSTDVLPQSQLPVSVTFDGVAAEITYAGAAPTLVSGAL